MTLLVSDDFRTCLHCAKCPHPLGHSRFHSVRSPVVINSHFSTDIRVLLYSNIYDFSKGQGQSGSRGGYINFLRGGMVNKRWAWIPRRGWVWEWDMPPLALRAEAFDTI